MDNVVTVINSKHNTIQFDLAIEGLKSDDVTVKLVVETHGVELGFGCKVVDDNKWEVEIPPIDYIVITSYPYRIDVTVDGYYFEGSRGIINFTKSADVYLSQPKIKLEPAVAKSVPAPAAVNDGPPETPDAVSVTDQAADTKIDGFDITFEEEEPTSDQEKRLRKLLGLEEGAVLPKKKKRPSLLDYTLKS